MSEKQVIRTDGAPGAIGPYSQGMVAGDFVFTAGQIPLDPATGKLVEGDISTMAHRVMQNLKAVLEAGGSDLDHIVKTTVFLTDMADYAAVNAVYGEYVGDKPPARSAFAVVGLPAGARLEIEAVGLRVK